MRTVIITAVAVIAGTTAAAARPEWYPPPEIYVRAYKAAQAVPASNQRACWKSIGKVRGRALAVTARDMSSATNGGRIALDSSCADTVAELALLCPSDADKVPCLGTLQHWAEFFRKGGRL